MFSQVRVSQLSALLCAGLLACSNAMAGFDDLFKSAGGLLEGATPALGTVGAGALSDSQINAGLKEALGIGAERAVALLGQSGGFLNDSSVRIPLPGALETVGKGLRAVGQGHYVDEFETTVNRAAEQAVPKTLDIVKQTVSDMTLQDVRGILSGGDDAATRFLRERAGPHLHAAIKPIVSQATDSAGATAAYKQLVAQYTGSDSLGALGGGLGASLGGLFGGASGQAAQPASLDLDEYVTTKALDGLFVKLAAEERAIRENPLARTTDLLQTVFGN
jgi:hypothetical protein